MIPEHHPHPSPHSDQIERWRDALVELNIRAWLMMQRQLASQNPTHPGLTLDEFTAHITAHPVQHHDNPAISEMLVSWVLGTEHPPEH
ncbi:MAG TPA: hypothetical protein VNL77_16460 [Roseiflexaceae bacterium]|nr:hypothetical protein [Roseiflexaceae bacterium]